MSDIDGIKDPKYDPRNALNQRPKILDKVADVVLSYRVPARTEKAKKRQRKRRAQRESSI